MRGLRRGMKQRRLDGAARCGRARVSVERVESGGESVVRCPLFPHRCVLHPKRAVLVQPESTNSLPRSAHSRLPGRLSETTRRPVALPPPSSSLPLRLPCASSRPPSLPSSPSSVGLRQHTPFISISVQARVDASWRNSPKVRPLLALAVEIVDADPFQCSAPARTLSPPSTSLETLQTPS